MGSNPPSVVTSVPDEARLRKRGQAIPSLQVPLSPPPTIQPPTRCPLLLFVTSSDMAPKAKTTAGPKNWRCDHCGNTDNKSFWTYCGRTTCGKPWQPHQQHQDQQGQGNWGNWGKWDKWGYVGKWDNWQTPEDGDECDGKELRDARNTLRMLSTGPSAFPANHATITEYTALVYKLEREQASQVSTEDRLRDLLSLAVTRKSDKDWADAAVGKQVVSVRNETKELKVRMEAAEQATAAFNQNTLEIAQITRPAAAAPPTAPAAAECPIQALRGQIDKVDPQLLVQHGATGEKLAEFFRIFANVSALLQHVTPSGEVEPALAGAMTNAAAPAEVAPAIVEIVGFDAVGPETVPASASTTAHAAVGTDDTSLLPTTKKVRKNESDWGPMAVDETKNDFSDEELNADDAMQDAHKALAQAGSVEPVDKKAEIALESTAGGSSG